MIYFELICRWKPDIVSINKIRSSGTLPVMDFIFNKLEVYI